MVNSAGELWLTASQSQAQKAPGFFQLFTGELIATILAVLLGLLVGMCLANGVRVSPSPQVAPIAQHGGGTPAAGQAQPDSIGATK